MANPTTREELKQWCLRRLGKPVIQINVDDAQLEDRIDEALNKFYDYHHEGTQKDYLSYQITAQDLTNKYITVADSIIYVTRIFSVGSSNRNTFSAAWQLEYSAFATLSDFIYGGGISSYVIQQSNIALMQQFLASQKQISFNRHMNRIYVHTDWERLFKEDDYIVFEIYRQVNPTTYADVYNDAWVKKYTTSLFKHQWGSNLRKYNGVALLNGVTLDGQQIIQEAMSEMDKLDEELLEKYSYPPMPIIG